jgi:flagellar FliL protein
MKLGGLGMSDSEELDLEGGDAPEAGDAPKKKGGLGALLPTLLKFVAIGLGALIFIVTVSVITVNVVNKGGKSQTAVIDNDSPYLGKRPMYTYYNGIGSINTRTKDPINHTVTVEMLIGYDIEDQVTSAELITRLPELQEFVRKHFAGKYAADLVPEKEEQIKREIKEILNTRVLDSARVRNIVLKRLEVREVF